MKVIVAESVFAPEYLRHASLQVLALFNLGLDLRHALVLGFDAEASVNFAAWLNARPDYERETIQDAIDIGVEAEARGSFENVIRVEALPRETDWCATPPRVALGEALRLLALPLRITVEDSENDGAFLRSVVTGPERDGFVEALRRGWVELEHGGGNTSIKRKIGAISRDPGARLRSWIVIDGDGLAPGKPSAETNRIVGLCERNGIQIHALQRRAMENYVPPHQLDEHLRNASTVLRKAVGAFHRLPPAARHHYCMWGGFRADEDRPNAGDTATEAEIAVLTTSISPSDRAALADGFGKDIGDAFQSLIPQQRIVQDGIEAEMRPVFRRILRSV